MFNILYGRPSASKSIECLPSAHPNGLLTSLLSCRFISVPLRPSFADQRHALVFQLLLQALVAALVLARLEGVLKGGTTFHYQIPIMFHPLLPLTISLAEEELLLPVVGRRMDMVMALRWSIFRISAGFWSTCDHMFAPENARLLLGYLLGRESALQRVARNLT